MEKNEVSEIFSYILTASNVKAIQKLNEQELEQNIPFKASWHQEYKNTSFVYVGHLHPELTESDLLTIFSQYGVPIYVKLVRDYETGASKGFGYIQYEDFKSCVMAVDNFNGIDVAGYTMKVDHTIYEERRPKDKDPALIDDVDRRVRIELEKDFANDSKQSANTPKKCLHDEQTDIDRNRKRARQSD